jgi:hypothetical protein
MLKIGWTLPICIAMDTRVRWFLAPLIAILFVAGLVGAGSVRPTSTVALSTSAAQGSGAVPETAAPAEPVDTTVAPTSPTTTTTTPTPKGPRKPAVIAKERYGDYPAGTVLSGPVDIRGVVRDGSGATVANACVEVTTLGVPREENPLLDIRTGPDGAFATGFDLTTAADWTTVLVSDCSGAVPGFARQRVNVLTEAAQTHDVPVTVKPGSALRGILRNSADQSPLGGVCVLISMNDISSFGVITDTDGSWTLAGLPPGRFGLDARTPANGTCGFFGGTAYPYTSLMGPASGMPFQSSAGTGDIPGPGVFSGYDFYVAPA